MPAIYPVNRDDQRMSVSVAAGPRNQFKKAVPERGRLLYCSACLERTYMGRVALPQGIVAAVVAELRPRDDFPDRHDPAGAAWARAALNF